MIKSPPILDAPQEVVTSRERGEVACPHTKVAIVGAAEGREHAPGYFDGDPDWCVWALNEIHQPYYDRHFELHPVTVPPQDEREMKFLAECRAPCYVLHATPLVPSGVVFPMARLRAAGLRTDYFTCTFAYQIALAIVDGFREIGLYGLTLWRGSPRERLLEYACVAYWAGVAEGRGIAVHDECNLLGAPYLYGYDYDAELEYGEYRVQAALSAIHQEEAKRGVEWTPLQRPRPTSGQPVPLRRPTA